MVAIPLERQRDAATVRQLLPPSDGADPIAAYLAADRPAPPGRPWVLVNMVASADGATAVDGRSGPLAGPDDKALFQGLRTIADVVLAGAGTVRAEHYGAAQTRPDGRPGPRLAVVTRSGHLDPGSRLFESDPPPLILMPESCPADRRAALASVAEVVVAGTDDVDLAAALTALADRGAAVVLCEGGPTLNGHLLAADLVDEWCLTTAPLLAAGDARKAAVGTDLTAGPATLRLERLLESDGFLFARYLRQR